MSLQIRFTILIGKTALLLTRLLRRGSGSALPGLIAEKLNKNLLEHFSRQIPNKVLITGTNGKTTTQKILGNILKESGIKYIANASGSNMKRGILSTLIKNSDLAGNINQQYLILEVEEATLPNIVSEIKPTIIIVTNLFRDQLDAYGEIDRTRQFILKSIQLSSKSSIILNGDDPKVKSLMVSRDKTYFYSIKEEYLKMFKYEGKIDTSGDKDILCSNISINKDLSSTFKINVQNKIRFDISIEKEDFTLDAPGVFHIYNALAAILAAKILGINERKIVRGVNTSKAAFGRGESFTVDNIKYKILLVKNPAGLTLTLDLLKNVKKPKLIFILNDNQADGRDVSWIWDAHMEIINEIRPSLIIASGIRASDMLLRIKYSVGEIFKMSNDSYITKDKNMKIIKVDEIQNIHKKLISYLKNNRLEGDEIFVLPTYTAMLEFRKYLLGEALDE